MVTRLALPRTDFGGWWGYPPPPKLPRGRAAVKVLRTYCVRPTEVRAYLGSRLGPTNFDFSAFVCVCVPHEGHSLGFGGGGCEPSPSQNKIGKTE